MSTQSHNQSLLDLEPETIIELYELDLGEQDGVYRFHPGKNNTSDIIFGGYSEIKNNVPVQYPGHTYFALPIDCLLYTSPSPRDGLLSRMPSSA